MTIKTSIKIVLLLAVLFFSACRKNYLDVNNNPNRPTHVDLQLILPDALNMTVSTMTAYTQNDKQSTVPASFDFLAYWMQYLVPAGNFVIAGLDVTYSEPNTYRQGIWTTIYQNLHNYDNIDKAGVATKQPFYSGVAKIMEAYNFQTLVDIYGDVPYTQALQGVNNLRPKYDNQTAIYTDLVLKIDTGIALIKKDTVSNAGLNDIMFHGDHGLWARFANTVKLRILLRQSQVPSRAAYIQDRLKTFTSDGFLNPGTPMTLPLITTYSGEGAYINPGYTNSTDKLNPFWSFYGYTTSFVPTNFGFQYYKATTYGINFYQSTNDLRLGYIYSPVNGSVAGSPHQFVGGLFGGQNQSSLAGIGGNTPPQAGTPDPAIPAKSGLLQSPSQDAVLLSSFENAFILAEATQRGWITTPFGSARNLYERAVALSYEYLNVNGSISAADAAAAVYVAQPIVDVGFAASPNPIEVIIKQKWAALNSINVVEAYDDYRRLNIPNDLPKSPQASTNFPIRLYYPQVEHSTNAANVDAAEKSVPSIFTTKIFWQP